MHNATKRTKGCGAMQLVGRKREISTGEAGLPAYKREAYREQFAACGFDLPDVTHFDERPASKSPPLKWAKPSLPSTIGDLIRTAIESTVDNITNKVRNYCSLLNQPQRHDSEAITDHLTDLLKWEAVENVKRFRKVPVHRDTLAAIVTQAIVEGRVETGRGSYVRPSKEPDVSTLGTRIIEAIQTAAGYRINCGQCKSYLNSLNKTLAPDDAETIVGKIIGGIGLPAKIREEVGGTKAQQVWLRSIVETVIAET